VPEGAPIRPNGNPAGVVEEGVGKDLRRSVVLAAIKGANLHGRDLPAIALAATRSTFYMHVM
jgi:hypothetical protein